MLTLDLMLLQEVIYIKLIHKLTPECDIIYSKSSHKNKIYPSYSIEGVQLRNHCRQYLFLQTQFNTKFLLYFNNKDAKLELNIANSPFYLCK